MCGHLRYPERFPPGSRMWPLLAASRRLACGKVDGLALRRNLIFLSGYRRTWALVVSGAANDYPRETKRQSRSCRIQAPETFGPAPATVAASYRRLVMAAAKLSSRASSLLHENTKTQIQLPTDPHGQYLKPGTYINNPTLYFLESNISS